MEVFERLKGLKLPAGDFAVFGSGPLIARGIIPQTNDLDVLCRGAAWQQVQRLADPTFIEELDVTIVVLDDGRLTFGNRWAIGEFDIDTLIDTAEEIHGIPFVRMEHVVSYKKTANRRKDREHLAAFDAWLEARDE